MSQDKIKKLIRLYAKKFGSEKRAINFLKSTNQLFGNQTPLQYALESDFNYGQVEYLADKLQK